MMASEKTYLEYVDEKSSKFWEIELDGSEHTVRYGRIGSDGRSLTKEFDTPTEAQESADKLIAKKKKKGYREVTPAELPPTGALSLDDAELIGDAEARERLALGDYVHAWGDEIRFVDGDLFVADDLRLDDVPDLFVDGDLTVRGDVCNFEGDFGPFLIVLGDLEARNLVGGGSEIVIKGDATVENTIFGHYNHGTIEIGGDVRAQAVVNDDHFITIVGEIDAVTIDTRSSKTADFDGSDLERALVPEVLSPEGWIERRALYERMLEQNEPPMRPGVKPTRLLVEEELESLVDPVVLELSDKKLDALPRRVTELRTLETLDISDNSIGELPEDFGELSQLRELTMRALPLETLPSSFTRLTNLEVLDLRRTPVQLPDDIGRLQSLGVLRIGPDTDDVVLPDSLADLPALEELTMSGSSWRRRTKFPAVVGRITSLKRLDVSGHAFEFFGPELANLVNLEELNVNSSLMRVTRFPDLSPLTKLTKLAFNGSTNHTGEQYPPSELIEDIMHLGTLEHLGLDRWGAKEDRGRPDRLKLPDRFDELPNLRTIDLAFNDLQELPESFYELEHLEYANFRYNTDLPADVCRRLMEAFPLTKLNFDQVRTLASDRDDPQFAEVHELVKSAADSLRKSHWTKAAKGFEAAVTRAEEGALVSEYDRLYAHYGVTYALSHKCAGQSPGSARERTQRKLMDWAERTLELVPAMIWHFTPLGQFQREAIRVAGNALAWHLCEAGEDLDRALDVVERAAEAIDDHQHWFIFDTKVRVLLALGRTDEAYSLVARVLERDPSFDDFRDIKASEDYQAWRSTRG